ncbi:hypothetical protein Glove_230g181 [Diversispora epigaea]|uniref:Uncharacterized protein n=1 Tax=Diversispora epigaea TaxID=1348612 RepID=A0A397IIK5_9GLOM|nr:hypothetical protein Glove_230g181 [Diversispora epigaea]
MGQRLTSEEREDNSFNNRLDNKSNNCPLKQEQKENEYTNNKQLNFNLSNKSKEKIRIQLLLDYLQVILSKDNQVIHQQPHHLQQLEPSELLHDKDAEPTRLLKVFRKQYLLDDRQNKLLHVDNNDNENNMAEVLEYLEDNLHNNASLRIDPFYRTELRIPFNGYFTLKRLLTVMLGMRQRKFENTLPILRMMSKSGMMKKMPVL